MIIKTDWVFPASDFKRQLLAWQPTVQMRDIEDTSRPAALDFEFSMGSSVLFGTFYRKGKSVSFSGELADCAAFAHWFRQLIPSGEEVVFCDEMVNVSLDLSLETTPADVVNAVLAS
ncbi:hypothetical protein F0U62_07370 [Cystobacter fuscus]|uniref:hypothetical protein n=1 Tax=Cystobacter fuscus TaxID=43 RepID=UPI002B2F3136|nr:hypothetical protein F0U62_07370 [Cystobacter fuscus]